jgi:uncharacterized protein (DUF885 family)
VTARTLFFLLSISACGARVRYAGEAPDDPTSRFNRFLGEVQLARLDRDPGLRDRTGLAPLGGWPDPSGRADVVDAALTREERDRLEQFSPVALDTESRQSHRLLTYETGRRLERLRWSGHEYLALPGEGPIAHLEQRLLDPSPWRTIADAEAWIDRVSAAGPWLDRMDERLDARQGRGLLAPKLALTRVGEQTRGLLQGRPFDHGASQDGLLMGSLRAHLAGLDELTPSEREDLLLRGEVILRDDLGPALERWLTQVEALAEESPGDGGIWSLPEGEAWYASRVRDATTLPLTAQALHQLGIEEVARLHDELRSVMASIDHPGSQAEFLRVLQGDPLPQTEPGATTPMPPVELAAAYQARLLDALDQVLETPPSSAHRLDTAALGIDGSDRPELPRHQVLALVGGYTMGRSLREAVIREHPSLPPFRRTLAISAWADGWDLYAAGLPLELGLAEDPSDALEILIGELWAAALLVVDTGLHQQRWTPEQARAWLQTNTPAHAARADAAISELLTHPGVAVAGPVGCLYIRELRADAESRLGTRFDLREFHGLVLGSGPLTLGMLERRVLAWGRSR